MKDIEKLFEEKLKDHQVAPNPQSWDKLQQQMKNGAKKHVIPMFAWRAAAVVLLLAGAFLVRYFYVNEKTQPATNIARQQQIQQTEKQQDDTIEAEVTKDNLPQKPPQTVALSQPKEAQKTESSIQKTDTPVQQEAVKKQAEVSQPERQPMLATVAKVASQQMHEFNQLADHQIVTASAPSFVVAAGSHMPVKVTYKGEAPDEVENDDNRAFAFLDNLKTSSLSFSELRQAKDELVSRAFSSRND